MIENEIIEKKLNFKATTLENLNLYLAYKDNPTFIEAFNRDITNAFLEEVKLTISKFNKIPQNLISDIIGRRGKGKSWLALRILEKYYIEFKEETKIPLKECLFWSNTQLLNYLEDNIKDLEEVFLWKDERHEEFGVDSIIAKVKLERFVDECRKRRINIFFVSPKQYFFNTDYTILRIDWDLDAKISRNLVFGKEKAGSINSLPLGLLYATAPQNQKLIEKYEKLKDKHLKKLLKGEKVIDVDKYVIAVMKKFNLEDKKKLGKDKFKALLLRLFPDLSYQMIEITCQAYQLYKDGYIKLRQLSDKELEKLEKEFEEV